MKSSSRKRERGIASSAIILLVEDDHLLRRILAEKLRREGFSVLEALTGEEALRLARSEHSSLVLLDILLPGGSDGFKVLEQLKSDAATAGIPVVILSNLGEREHIARALGLGAVEYLVKAHVVPDDVIVAVQRRLSKADAAEPKR